jgi:hypothetical protein
VVMWLPWGSLGDPRWYRTRLRWRHTVEDAVKRMRALGGRLESVVKPEGDGGNLELTRTREELQKTRRQLAKRNRELAELRGRMGENRVDPLSATMFPRRADGQEGVPPFFIVGPPKSGTSWLQATLNSHPEIFCSGEGKFFGRNIKTDNPFGQWGAEVSRALTGLNYETADRASLYSALADSKDLRSWFRRNGGWTRKEDVGLYTRALVRLTMDYIFAEARSRSGKQIVGDKTPSHVQYLEEIHEFYQEARIIHIIRDGRDQAVSTIFHTWRQAKDRGGFFPLSPEGCQRRDAYYEDRESFGPGKQSIFDEASLRALAVNWRESVTNAMETGPLLFSDRYFELKYEELLNNPETFFAEIITFLGANSDEKLVAEIVEENSFENRSGNRTLGIEDPLSFLRKGIAGDWANHFTERDKRIYKDEAGELLIRLGYERDNDW